MTGVTQGSPPCLSVELFRRFLDSRPEKERWELIDGVAVRMELHETCNCILIVQQDRLEVRVDMRTQAGWKEQVLTKPDELLALPEFGLRCQLSDLYRGTALQPREAPK
jgi:hypothetical protein